MRFAIPATLLAALATACCIAALPAAAAVGPPTTCPGAVKIASGRTGGGAWTLRATTSVSDGFVRPCFVWTYSTRPYVQIGRSGFSLRPSPYDSTPKPWFGMGLSYTVDCPSRHVAWGAVVSSARVVELTLANGTVIRTVPIPPPKGLLPGIGFYIAQLPCDARLPRQVVGRDAKGKVVSRITPFFHP